MKLSPIKRAKAYIACVKELVTDLRDRPDRRGFVLSLGVRLGTLFLAEAALQTFVASELGVGLLTGPFALIVEPLIMPFVVAEEAIGALAFLPLARWTGKTFDNLYDNWYRKNHLTSSDAITVPYEVVQVSPTPALGPYHPVTRKYIGPIFDRRTGQRVAPNFNPYTGECIGPPEPTTRPTPPLTQRGPVL